jgi:hypothetical protein
MMETVPPDPSKVTPDILALITHSKHFAVKHAPVWSALKTSFLSQREHRQQLEMALDCSWSEEFYLRANPEVNRMIRDRLYASGRDHFQMRGRLEGCAYQAAAPDVWDEVRYLKSHPEIATAVANGIWASGWDHYIRLGRYEGRRSIRIEEQQLAGLNEIARMCLTAISRDGV